MEPSNGYGSYLIRDSETDHGDYSLSVRDREQVRHYGIRRLRNGEFFVTRHISFETIPDLVAYYQKQADGLCVNLIRPCALSESPQATDLSKQANDEWEIDRREIRIIRKLMDGKFSEVWEGLWNGITPVAVKMRKPQTMNAQDFLQTAALMKKLRHQKLIKLYAVCMKEEPMYIITELMKHNCLLEYLRGDGRQSTKLPQLIDMASQVAEGMAYLEEKNYIHRDLAVRNIILVGEHLICKVANFEMARMIDEDIHEVESNEKFAIKWTAPEAALFNRFTIKSDVWSFGIVLYEIITYGRIPYTGMPQDQVIEKLQQGYRMSQPMGCPDKLYDIMLNCWRDEPANRPTFETLQWQLEEFFTAEDGGYHKITNMHCS